MNRPYLPMQPSLDLGYVLSFRLEMYPYGKLVIYYYCLGTSIKRLDLPMVHTGDLNFVSAF